MNWILFTQQYWLRSSLPNVLKYQKKQTKQTRYLKFSNFTFEVLHELKCSSSYEWPLLSSVLKDFINKLQQISYIFKIFNINGIKICCSICMNYVTQFIKFQTKNVRNRKENETSSWNSKYKNESLLNGNCEVHTK